MISRRDFLGTSTAAAAGAALTGPDALSAQWTSLGACLSRAVRGIHAALAAVFAVALGARKPPWPASVSTRVPMPPAKENTSGLAALPRHQALRTKAPSARLP